MTNAVNEKAFSLGRLDIIDLYEWHSTNKLVYQTYFQRQSVWKEKDKSDLIDTIMKGYPIPSIFICDAKTNLTSLSKTYNVLDGRQRLESIFGFLRNEFKYKGKTYSDLEENDKKKILNYNLSLVQMYLEPEDTDKIKEIFKRLNKNSYNLNKMEKQSTQLVEYDFMIIGKIISGIIQFENIDDYVNEINNLFSEEENNEQEIDGCQEDAVNPEIKDICSSSNVDYISNLLKGSYVFTAYERQRQIPLQYFLNIFACVLYDEIIHRNVSELQIIELSDRSKTEIINKLRILNRAAKIIFNLYETDISKFWKNKSSFFTLCVAIYNNLTVFEAMNSQDLKVKLESFEASKSAEWGEYVEASKQGVNDKAIRKIRNDIIETLLA